MKHCWKSVTREGWGCKYISSLKFHLGCDGRNKGSYWYDMGRLNEKNEWIVDKGLIKAIIFEEIKRKGYDLCPFLSQKQILEKINSLPDIIIPDRKEFRYVYERDFDGRNIKNKPVGIEHIPGQKEIRQRARQEGVNGKGRKGSTKAVVGADR